MTPSEMALIIAIGSFMLSIIAILFSGLKYKVSRDMRDIQRENQLINEKKTRPKLNIHRADVRIYNNERNKRTIRIYVDNSGGGPANFPMYYFELVSKDNKKYHPKKYIYFIKQKRSFIPDRSVTHVSELENFLLDKEMDNDDFEILKVWIKYSNNSGKKWCAYTELKYVGEIFWKPSFPTKIREVNR